MSVHHPRPTPSSAGRWKRPEQKNSHNAQRSYERYVSLARAEAALGKELSLRENKASLIILNPRIGGKTWEKLSDEELAMAVAHEIAHAYLGHKISTSKEKNQTIELAADKQAIAWLKPHWKKRQLIKYAYYINPKYDKKTCEVSATEAEASNSNQ